MDDFDVMNALYGREQVRVSITDATAQQIVRAPDGYWYGGTAWLHTNVSGVLVSKNLHPGTVADHLPCLWLHPQPDYELPQIDVWRRVQARETEFAYVDPAISPRDLFGLPDEWPTGERFPER